MRSFVPFVTLLFLCMTSSAANGPSLDYLLRGLHYSPVIDFTFHEQSFSKPSRGLLSTFAMNRRTERERVDLDEEILAALTVKIILLHTVHLNSNEFGRRFGSPAAVVHSIKKAVIDYLDPDRFLLSDSEISFYMSTRDPAIVLERFKSGNWNDFYTIFPTFEAAILRYHLEAFNPDDPQSVQQAYDQIFLKDLGNLGDDSSSPILRDLTNRLRRTRIIERSELDAVELAILHQRQLAYEKARTFHGRFGPMETIFTAVVESLDRYSHYYQGDRYRTYLASQPHPLAGHLGFHLRETLSGLYVEKVDINSPAHRAGVQPGDIVLSVNDQSFVDLDRDARLELIVGTPGAKAKLIVVRGDNTLELEAVWRKREPATSQVVDWYGRKLGFIDLNEFSGKAVEDFAHELRKLNSRRVHGLVLDLSNNSGGQMQQALDIASLLLGESVPFTYFTQVEGRGGVPQQKIVKILSTKNIPLRFDKPIVVLTSGTTAGAAELLAAILKNHNRAVVVGSRTSGQGTLQSSVMMNNIRFKDNRTGKYVRVKDEGAGLLMLTTAYFADASGLSPQARGVEPDIELFKDTPINGYRSARVVPSPLRLPAVDTGSYLWTTDGERSNSIAAIRTQLGYHVFQSRDLVDIRAAALLALEELIDTLGPQFGPPPTPEQPGVFKQLCYRILGR